MKKKTFYLTSIAAITFAAIMFTVSSCNKSEQVVTPHPPANEFITTVVMQCINNNAPHDTETCIWRDVTPSGTNPPDTTEAYLNLARNTTYAVKLYALDETKTSTAMLADTNHFNINKIASTTVDVQIELEQRVNYHLICFTLTQGTGVGLNADLSIVRDDYDNNNPPLQVGFVDTFTSLNNGVSGGRMEVVQHHQPNVKNGDCAPGSIDYDVFFNVNVR
jgi:hypothetical protein